MQPVAIALILGLGTTGTAAAQTYGAGSSTWQRNVTPQAPKAPGSPYVPQPPAFKPYQGSSTYSSRGGLNPYPAPAKPRSTTTSLFGPDGKPKR
jgi:hypothetical protein